MTHVEKHIEVDCPVRTVYNQYTQFEEFPRFMEGVEEVRQLTDTKLHWKVRVGGVEREFDAEITEQIPDKRIAWKSVDGKTHSGVVTFHRLSDDQTRIAVQMGYEPEGFVEKVADAAGFLSRRVQGDLERFKEFLETRGHETGAWRGDVRPPEEGGGVHPPKDRR